LDYYVFINDIDMMVGLWGEMKKDREYNNDGYEK
jgi:hypothetical protein